MRQFFWLLKDPLPLAAAEVIALAKPKQAAQIGDILIVDTKEKDFHNRLAFTRSSYRFLFSCHVYDLEGKMKSFDWQKHYKKSFKLVAHHSPIPTTKLAKDIYDNVRRPNVDLKSPATVFELFFQGTAVIAGKRLATIDATPFFERRPHLRPELHPSSMHPRLARALINLTGAKKGTIVDPFCGSGQIPFEAARMGCDVYASDLNPIACMLRVQR